MLSSTTTIITVLISVDNQEAWLTTILLTRKVYLTSKSPFPFSMHWSNAQAYSFKNLFVIMVKSMSEWNVKNVETLQPCIESLMSKCHPGFELLYLSAISCFGDWDLGWFSLYPPESLMALFPSGIFDFRPSSGSASLRKVVMVSERCKRNSSWQLFLLKHRAGGRTKKNNDSETCKRTRDCTILSVKLRLGLYKCSILSGSILVANQKLKKSVMR